MVVGKNDRDSTALKKTCNNDCITHKSSGHTSLDPYPAVIQQQQFKPGIIEDTHLMNRVSRGDRRAFNALCSKNKPVLIAFFRRSVQCWATVEDLTQEVFSRVWGKREQYRPGTPDLPYLKGFARLVLREYQTKDRQESYVNGDSAVSSSLSTEQNSPRNQAENTEQAQIICDAISNLPAKQRQAVKLVYFNSLTATEAASVMNCSRECLCMHLCLARKRLARLLKL